MLKKSIALLLIIGTVLCLSACGTEENVPALSSSEHNQTSREKSNSSTISSQSEETKKPSKVTQNSTSTKVNPSNKNSHTHKYTTKNYSATCKQQGYTLYSCNCGHSYKDNYKNGNHKYVNNRCSYCNKMNLDGLFNHLKDWVINNGSVNGDYVSYTKTADNYGGYNDENFSLFYWADTDKIEFCLHSVLDSDYSINFYIYIPKSYSGKYEYITSYYYRDTGESVCESKGIIDGSSFTKKYPLNSKEYFGPSNLQNDFMEMSRKGICDVIGCLKVFLEKENIGYTISDLGFKNF